MRYWPWPGEGTFALIPGKPVPLKNGHPELGRTQSGPAKDLLVLMTGKWPSP